MHQVNYGGPLQYMIRKLKHTGSPLWILQTGSLHYRDDCPERKLNSSESSTIRVTFLKDATGLVTETSTTSK